ILGREKAEYFLHPPPMDFRMSSALQQILDEARGSLGAKEMWAILKEKSQQRLHQEFPEETSQYSDNILKTFAQRPVMKKVLRKRRHLSYLRQASEYYQDISRLLLVNKDIPDVGDSQVELQQSGNTALNGTT
ncbi:hypothetical protein GDO86_007174, partial [Hymenochirus boettgeri]